MAEVLNVKLPSQSYTPESFTLPESYILPKEVKFGFHPVTGQNIVLSDRHTASRIKPRQGLGGCIAYGEKPLKGTTEIEVEIVKFDDSEPRISIRLGVMKLRYNKQLKQEDMPRYSEDGDNYCVLLNRDIYNNFSTDGSEMDDIAELHECKKRKSDHLQESSIIKRYSPRSLQDLGITDRVGMHISKHGDLMFLINDQSLGIAASNIYQEGYKVYPVLDLMGKCCSAKITRADMKTEINLQELCIEMIASSCTSSTQVQSLPLPRKLKNRICLYMY